MTAQDVEFDAIEEVDAVVRTLRRAAVEYGALLLGALVAVPILSAVAPWWFARRIWGGITLNFLALALLLHLVFIVIAVAYTRFASHVETEMLGRPAQDEELDD